MPATPVQPATRRLYWVSPTLTIERPPTVHRAASGRRDNVFQVTQGSIVAGGSMSMPMSADESLEIFNMAISGAPVITTPATGTTARLHTYKPGDLMAATLEWFDGKRGWIGSDFKANTLTIEGSVDGDSTISAELFGSNLLAGTVTPGLAERDPAFLEGWKVRLYSDVFAGTPGATVMAGTLVNWNVQLANALARVYTADNTQSANRVISGELDVTASLTFDADAAGSIAEFNNWVGGVKRMVRLEFQDETAFIEAALRRFVTVDIGGIWTAVDISGENAGVRTYALTFQSIYSAAMAAMLQVRVQCPRLLAFA